MAGALAVIGRPPADLRILAGNPYLKPLTVPAGSYPGQAEPLASVGSVKWQGRNGALKDI